jgi:acyl-CoA synthetase (AMP-forming)/AMP-acid ligase II
MADTLVITEEYTIPRALKESIQQRPDQLAQVDGNGRMTYGELGASVNRLASGLQDLGVQPGEKVALVLPSGNYYPVAMFGVIQMGGVSVGINPTLRSNEFEHIFSDSEAVAVIVADSIPGVDPISIIREMRPNLPLLRHVIVIGEPAESEINYEHLLEKAEIKDEYHQADPNDLTVLLYTSGTTGLPKGSMHSHHTLLYHLMGSADPPPTLKELVTVVRRYGFGYLIRVLKSIGKPVRLYGSTPPYTAAGMIGVITLYIRGQIFYQMDKFVPSEVCKLVEKEAITVIGFPPALGALLVKHQDLKKYDLSSLLYVLMGAAPVPPSLVDEVIEKIGVPVAIGYGASELFGGPTVQKPFSDSIQALRETVGKVKDDYEVKVVDEDHNTLPIGDVGELVVRGGIKMLGYYKADELTKKTFDEDGWYYTGDLATIDKEGYVRIVGRVKDMIIRGGQNIYPAELEEILITHPKVRQAAVFGIPDALAGEKVLAHIIPNGDQTLSVIEILNFCRERMAPYKVPSNIRFVQEFPLNSTGKVLKRVLREQELKLV